MRYRGNKICADEQTNKANGRTDRKHNAFVDSVGCRGIKPSALLRYLLAGLDDVRRPLRGLLLLLLLAHLLSSSEHVDNRVLDE